MKWHEPASEVLQYKRLDRNTIMRIIRKKICQALFFFVLFYFLNFRILFIYLYSWFLLVTHFTHISIYMSIPISQFITAPQPTPCHFPTLVSIHLFSTSVSLFLPCKLVHLYHFSRFHIYALIYDICFSFSDLLHSV